MSKNPKRKADGKFALGHTGNPAGRPKTKPATTTAEDFTQILRKVAFGKLSRPNPDGTMQTISRLEWLLERLWAKGLKGDTRAAEKFINVLFSPAVGGKPAPSLEALQEMLEDDVAILENHNAKLRRAEAEPAPPGESGGKEPTTKEPDIEKTNLKEPDDE
jgi:hypothetical protein